MPWRAQTPKTSPAAARGAHQLVEGGDGLPQRDLRVGLVRQVEVDAVGAEPPQAGLDLLADVARRQPLVPGSRPDPVAHFGGEHDLVARLPARQPAADHLLRAAEPVGVGGVEQGDPGLQRRIHERERRRLVIPPADQLGSGADTAEVAAAERDHRHLGAPAAQADVAHASTLLDSDPGLGPAPGRAAHCARLKPRARWVGARAARARAPRRLCGSRWRITPSQLSAQRYGSCPY